MLYDVPLIPQSSEMSCWAASMAMIIGWKTMISIPDHIIAKNPGGLNYMTSYEKGLDPNDQYILTTNGFKIESPKNYLIDAIDTLLKKHSPLWVATWAPGPHIRVVTGIKGDTL